MPDTPSEKELVGKFEGVEFGSVETDERFLVSLQYQDVLGEMHELSFQPSDLLYLQALLRVILKQMESRMENWSRERVLQRLIDTYEFPSEAASNLWRDATPPPSNQ